MQVMQELAGDQTEDNVTCGVFASALLDGSFPRQPLCCFLTGSDSTIETEDQRVPVVGSRVVPLCVRYGRARGNNLECYAVARKVVRHPCQVAAVKGAPGGRVTEGSAEHYEQSERAKQMAWRHVELALTGDQPDSVDKRAGTGQLTGSGFYRCHGDPWGVTVIMKSSCTRPQGHT